MQTVRRTINSNSQPEAISTQFQAQAIHVSNPTPQWIFIRVGGSDPASSANYDLMITPFSFGQYVIAPSAVFSVSPVTIGNIPFNLSTYGRCVVTFYDNQPNNQIAVTSIRDEVLTPLVTVGEGFTSPTSTTYTLVTCPSGKLLVIKSFSISFNSTYAITGIPLFYFNPSPVSYLGLDKPTMGIVHNWNFQPTGWYGELNKNFI